MATSSRFFYGWLIIPVAWLVYGFGISPGYYSWGQFAPALIEDLQVDREDIGGVFGIFTFLYSAVGLFVGLGQKRFGIRAIMVLGSLMAAAGFFLMSRADSVLDCYIGFAILGGTGIGLSTIIPCQTLAATWFLKYRARAIGIIFTAGGIVGLFVPEIDGWLLENFSWQQGWLVVAAISTGVAVLALVFVRNSPEDMGQHPDGMKTDLNPSTGATKIHSVAAPVDRWTAGAAIRTPQFMFLVLCGIAYAVPWGVVVAHGRLHLDDVGIESDAAIDAFKWMILISIAGRFTGSLGDWISPQKVLGASLLLESFGVAGLLMVDSTVEAYVFFIMIGLGFGAAYISVPVVFAEYFGRHAFATTSGMRILITGIFNALGPWLSGMAFERAGSYTVAFITLVVLGLVGSASAFFCPKPTPPEAPETDAENGE